MPKVLLLGGKGQIGSGLRTYLPRLDPTYEITTIDLPGAEDKATQPDAQQNFIDLDINEDHEGLHDCTGAQDLVVYLARRNPHEAMNAMTDLVFNTLLAQGPVPMVVAASSVHACDGAYSVHEGTWAEWANRDFTAYATPPDRVLATIPACPTSDYGREKAHVEEWCQKPRRPGSRRRCRTLGRHQRGQRNARRTRLLRALVPPRRRCPVRPRLLHLARQWNTP